MKGVTVRVIVDMGGDYEGMGMGRDITVLLGTTKAKTATTLVKKALKVIAREGRLDRAELKARKV